MTDEAHLNEKYQNILSILREKQALTMTQIAQEMKLPAPAFVQHQVMKLEHLGLVWRDSAKRWHAYSR